MLSEDRTLSVDGSNVGAIGHSQGATGALNGAILANGRIRTAIALDLPAPRWCFHHQCDRIPGGLTDRTSVLYLSGAIDRLSPPASVAAYLRSTPGGIERAAAAVEDAGHNDVQGKPNCGAIQIGCKVGVKNYLPVITAWLKWQLSHDANAEKLFEGIHPRFLAEPGLLDAQLGHAEQPIRARL
jgi:pimeloyl-ACP methyl ester carboxylesterase